MKNKILIFVVFLISMNSAYSQQDCSICFNENNEENDYSIQNSDVDYSFRYFTVGGGPFLLIPNIGIGYRERHAKTGWDLALSFSSIGVAHQLGAYVVGHYYLNPPIQNSFYLGCGILGSSVIINDGSCDGYLSPNFVFGKELKQSGEGHHFLELHLAAPSLIFKPHHCGMMYIPLIYIKYGVSF